MAKVFITKYALTSGIKEMELEIVKSNFANSPDYVRDGSWTFFISVKMYFWINQKQLKQPKK